MDNNDLQLVGAPCGHHGPYTFYKAFKYAKNNIKRIVALSEFFFVKMWRDSDLLCIGELQLLWIDKNSEQMLASLRLYFLPENTPDGRMDHGEDEVLAISEKVVIRVEDLITWITVEAEWSWGRLANHEAELKPVQVDQDKLAPAKKSTGVNFGLTESTLDFTDVENERQQFETAETNPKAPHVIILSFTKYCRYRAMMKRLEGVEDVYLKYKIVNALGGFYVIHPNTRVLFCRDTFDYPELEGHELLCNHLAPKLKGRPRGKRKKRSVSPGGSESNESESSVSNHYTRSTDRDKSSTIRSDSPVATRRSTRCHENNENKQFIKTLTVFMKSKRIPMGRVPSLGYKELNLHEFFTRVQKLGGYDSVTINKLWKSIFEDMSGHHNSTSAATVIRRHYERFLLAYERHIKGEEYKPLPVSERRRLKSKRGSTCTSTSSVSDGESSNGDATPPFSRQTSSPNVNLDIKDSVNNGKTSSLRSIRVKPERQKDKQNLEKSITIQSNTTQDLNSSTETELNTVKLENAGLCNNKTTETNTNSETLEPIKSEIEDKIKLERIDPSDSVDQNTPEDKTNILLDNKSEILPIDSKDIIKSEQMIKSIKSEQVTTPDDVKAPVKLEVPPPIVLEKDIEPLTSAIAPIAQKLSPVDGKENIPLIKTTTGGSLSPDIIEVPLFKPAEPTSNFKSFITDVKKIKLDILKEGGLEVTPVKPILTSPTMTKDVRPSVIQPTAQIKPVMPPPIVTSVASKRTPPMTSPGLTLPNLSLPGLNVTKLTAGSAKSAYFSNGATPPKVVQSRSIYSYSEKTVYGNPKDILQPSSASVLEKMYAQAPKFQSLGAVKVTGGDPVDLSVPSPQKPIVEIMRVPQASNSSNCHSPFNRDSVTKKLYKSLGGSNPSSTSSTSRTINSGTVNSTMNSGTFNSGAAAAASSLLDGRRLGSNLEITLVRPKAQAELVKRPNSGPYGYQQKTVSQKRPMEPSYGNKIAKSKNDENGRYSTNKHIPQSQPKNTSAELNVPNIYNLFSGANANKPSKPDSKQSQSSPLPPQPPKTFPSHPSVPPFMTQFHENSPPNGLGPFMPLMDSLYYQAAIQNIYSNNMGGVPPPILPIPTPETLKFYAELMAHGRLNFPFAGGQDGASGSVLNNNNMKK